MINAGLRKHLWRARKARQAARGRLDSLTHGLNTGQRMAVRDAYYAFLADRARVAPGVTPLADDSHGLPACVQAGPAIDWGGYDLAADYN